jgi:hypothetical protein
MFDKKVFVSVILASYALAVISRLLPEASPSSLAAYLPTFGQNGLKKVA